ncbi:helix-turn-helix domain-containing protein [Streptomyces sp. NEAU-YJ-81]|uniref:helix-turn-helix domain-containing protein n=1 Tax=Streptomyces sp. NEAU-YJ-81 TaxID=2820288 RepID=UPI0035ADA1CC
MRPPLLTDRVASARARRNSAHGADHPSVTDATASAHHPDVRPAPPTPSEPDSNTPHPYQLLHTAQQAALLLQVPPSWLRKKAAADQIPYTKVGRHLRFSNDDLNAIIRNGARGPRHPAKS